MNPPHSSRWFRRWGWKVAFGALSAVLAAFLGFLALPHLVGGLDWSWSYWPNDSYDLPVISCQVWSEEGQSIAGSKLDVFGLGVSCYSLGGSPSNPFGLTLKNGRFHATWGNYTFLCGLTGATVAPWIDDL